MKIILKSGLILLPIILSGCLNITADWENEDILFINTSSLNEVIISQTLDYGATDSDPSSRHMKLNIESGHIEDIEIENLSENWIKLNLAIPLHPFRGYMLYAGELKKAQEIGCDIFPHSNLTRFEKILLHDSNYVNIYPSGAGSKYYYSCQHSNEYFNSLIFRSGGGLILHTTTKEFKQLSNLELMRSKTFKKGIYKKYSEIQDEKRIEMTDSISFNFWSESNNEETLVLTYKNSFTILKDGNIHNEALDGIGLIKIKTVANKASYKQ